MYNVKVEVISSNLSHTDATAFLQTVPLLSDRV